MRVTECEDIKSVLSGKKKLKLYKKNIAKKKKIRSSIVVKTYRNGQVSLFFAYLETNKIDILFSSTLQIIFT